jgi:hypothetical protein
VKTSGYVFASSVARLLLSRLPSNSVAFTPVIACTVHSPICRSLIAIEVLHSNSLGRRACLPNQKNPQTSRGMRKSLNDYAVRCVVGRRLGRLVASSLILGYKLLQAGLRVRAIKLAKLNAKRRWPMEMGRGEGNAAAPIRLRQSAQAKSAQTHAHTMDIFRFSYIAQYRRLPPRVTGISEACLSSGWRGACGPGQPPRACTSCIHASGYELQVLDQAFQQAAGRFHLETQSGRLPANLIHTFSNLHLRP